MKCIHHHNQNQAHAAAQRRHPCAIAALVILATVSGAAGLSSFKSSSSANTRRKPCKTGHLVQKSLQLTVKSHAVDSESGCNWSKLSALHKFTSGRSQSHVAFELNDKFKSPRELSKQLAANYVHICVQQPATRGSYLTGDESG